MHKDEFAPYGIALAIKTLMRCECARIRIMGLGCLMGFLFATNCSAETPRGCLGYLPSRTRVVICFVKRSAVEVGKVFITDEVAKGIARMGNAPQGQQDQVAKDK